MQRYQQTSSLKHVPLEDIIVGLFVLLLSSVLVLITPNEQFFDCATFACSQRYGPRVL